MLTVAYIGNGKSANRYHIPFVRTRENIRVKTIYSPPNAPSPWAPIEGVNYVTDLNEIWNDPEIQLVVVCTPSATHVELGRQILEHGKNALVEKPFAQSAAEARELFELAKSKGLFLQSYQNRRYDSDFLTVQKVIESGVLGDLLEVEMHYDYYRPEVPTKEVPTFSPTRTFVFGHGVHTVDQVLSYFGSPKEVRYDVRQILGPGRMNDYFDIDMFYDGALKVSVKSSYFRVKDRPSFVVYGTKGMFVKQTKDRQEDHLKIFYMPGEPGFGVDLPEHYGTLTYYDDDGVFHEEKVVSEVGDYGRMYDGIYATLIEGKPKVVTDEQTIELMTILEDGVRPMLEREAGK